MVFRWVGWGLVMCVLAAAMCLDGDFRNAGVLPINKNLWSPSFVAALTGTGACALVF